jgi:hypothetical protein
LEADAGSPVNNALARGGRLGVDVKRACTFRGSTAVCRAMEKAAG